MKVVCPACHAEMTLDVLFSSDEARTAVGPVLERGLGLGGVAMRYIALFRPEQRRMSIERMCRLVAELLPDIERRAITRKGREWPAPLEVWRAGMETVLTKRDKGTLTLPLASHGLLYEVMCGLAEKAEAQAEREREEERKAGTFKPSGYGRGPRDLSTVMEAIGTAPAAPPPAYEGPSRAAREIKARMEAKRLAREGGEHDAQGCGDEERAQGPDSRPPGTASATAPLSDGNTSEGQTP